MNDTIITIVVVGIYTLLMPTIIKALEKRIKRKWLLYLILIAIAILLTTLIGSSASIIIYLTSK